MFNLQITLSDFRCRKRQLELLQQFFVVFRFGNIKIDIRISRNDNHFIGGKRIVLDLSAEELKELFLNFALGMFIENRSGKFFSILSLEKMQYTDIISGQQVYFYNDQQEIVYSASFSIIFTDFKNPRMPNKEVIQNHKTFNQFYTKPAVPTHTVAPKTLSSFLYGNQTQQQQKEKGKPKLTKANLGKTQPIGVKSKKNNALISSQQWEKKNINPPQFVATQSPENFHIYKPFDDNQDVNDYNPPVMQFTNTTIDPLKGFNLLKTQMAELNISAPESIKFMTAFDSKNGFLKTKQSDSRNTIIKIQEKLKTTQNKPFGQTKTFKQNINAVRIDRQDLRNKAKKEMQSYQGSNSIKIPVLKDGKYELVQLAHLNEQQIAKFAQKQKQIEFEQQMKKQREKQLQRRSKENFLLKKQLEEKEKLLAKQDEQAKRQKLQLSKAKQLADESKKISVSNKVSQSENQDQDNSDESEKYNEQSEQQEEDKEPEEEQEDNYESDFESVSMASAQKKSRISTHSQKKQDLSESLNDSYDPDFESYSQSFLGSQHKLSISQMSQSMRSNSPKRR